jgi:CHAD domain-containing protein
MPYRFRKKESITAGVRRIFREEGDKAIDELKGVALGKPQGLHEARKRMKKLRSLARLIKPRVGGGAAQVNSLLREASQPLSGARDAQAMVEAFDALVAWAHKPGLRETFDAVRARFIAARDAVQTGDSQLPAVVASCVDKLRDVREISQGWAVRPNSFTALSRGFGKSYRKGLEAMRQAYASPADEHFHAWRKEVKNHWYHVRLLRGLWPRMMFALAFELGTLSDLLGDDHDLAVMRLALAQERFDASVDLDAFVQLLDDRRRVLRRSARALGRRLYAEGPGKIRKRFKEYWNAWRAEDAKPEEVLGNLAAPVASGDDTSDPPGDADTTAPPGEPQIRIMPGLQPRPAAAMP